MNRKPKRLGLLTRLFHKPKESVIDFRLYKALTLCLMAADKGLVTIVSPEESSARLGRAAAALRQKQRRPLQAHQAEEFTAGA